MAPPPLSQLTDLVEKQCAQLNRADLDSLDSSFPLILAESLARRRRVLNDENAPILKLPTEILLIIGRLVLESRLPYTAKPKDLLPLLQICASLRSQMYLLREERLTSARTIYVSAFKFDNPWRTLSSFRFRWHGANVHRGPVEIYVDWVSNSATRSLTSAAALSGAIECKLYHRLQDPPTVYVYSCDGLFVSHGRERHMKESTGITPKGLEVFRRLRDEEGEAIWEKARRRIRGAPRL